MKLVTTCIILNRTNFTTKQCYENGQTIKTPGKHPLPATQKGIPVQYQGDDHFHQPGL